MLFKNGTCTVIDQKNLIILLFFQEPRNVEFCVTTNKAGNKRK